MDYKTKKNSNATVDIKLTFETSDLEKAFDKTYAEKQKSVKIPGFRPGKAPLNMVKRHLGDTVAGDAINTLIVDGMTSILAKLEHPMIRFPKFEIQDYQPGKNLIATAVYETNPEITLGKYKKIKVKLPEVSVSDSDVLDEIENIRKQLARKQLKEDGQTAAPGDIIDMEYTVHERGEEPKNQSNTSNDYRLGLESNLKGFDENLYGLKSGDKKEFSHTFPEDYSKDEVAGKTFEYSVTIKALYANILPAVDDDLASEFDGSDSLNVLKDKIRKNLKERFEEEIRSKKLEEIFKEIINDSKYIFPDSYLKEESEHVFHNMIHEFKLPHITMEEYAEKIDQDPKEVFKFFRNTAETRLKHFFTRQKIAEIENITYTETDFDADLEKLASSYEVSLSDLKKELEKRKLLDQYRENFFAKKVGDTLFDLVEKKYTDKLSIGQIKDYLDQKEEQKA
ncbi:trigger factor [Leptospira santarosai]|uniref:trigger factor n=1 Tax=Leptospira santarosai TaxID=28183 RepID=UPI0024AFF7A9|nr:trigger factor [Leptospira santarosai]MDI7189510.1 trigger factor [Leptospira santarosai]MDI7211115.1 trigger factor [Leptospira santarosai]MDI7213483.1 trigger factor [Leptospira santarosai]MDI7222373.1 trigger factor [Leptospira santarosai]